MRNNKNMYIIQEEKYAAGNPTYTAVRVHACSLIFIVALCTHFKLGKMSLYIV